MEQNVHLTTAGRFAVLCAAIPAWLCPRSAQADLLTGGLLGSALRGDAFTGPRLVDLLLVGLLIFLVLRLILGRQKPGGGQGPQGFDQSMDNTPPVRPMPPERPARPEPPAPDDHFPPQGAQRAKPDMYSNAQAIWDSLKTPPGKNGPATQPGQPAPGRPSSPDEEFLAGAKLAYGRITTALANRDFDDLANFVAPQFLAQLKNSLPLSPPPAPEVLLVEASIADKRQEGGRTVIEVEYKALVHEKDAPHNTDRFERWRFARDEGKPGANWLLEDTQRTN